MDTATRVTLLEERHARLWEQVAALEAQLAAVKAGHTENQILIGRLARMLKGVPHPSDELDALLDRILTMVESRR